MPDDEARLPRRPESDWTVFEAARRARDSISTNPLCAEVPLGELRATATLESVPIVPVQTVDWVDVAARVTLFLRRMERFQNDVAERVAAYERAMAKQARPSAIALYRAKRSLGLT